MKKHWHIWVGIAIVLLAVALVLGIIFIPRAAAKSDMKALLLHAAAADAQYVMLVDPAYKHPGILAGEGREIALAGDILTSTQDALTALADGFSYEKKMDASSGAFGMYLLVKTADGEIVKINLAKDAFYAELKGSVYYFTAKDTQAYTALYNALLAALPV